MCSQGPILVSRYMRYLQPQLPFEIVLALPGASLMRSLLVGGVVLVKTCLQRSITAEASGYSILSPGCNSTRFDSTSTQADPQYLCHARLYLVGRGRCLGHPQESHMLDRQPVLALG
jgi:hypothetical protein